MRIPAVLLATVVSLAACSDVQAPLLETAPSVASKRSAEHGPPFITTAVATTEWHSCGFAMGALRCWGWNSDGQLGNGESGTTEETPVLVNGPRFEQVSTGGFHTCALDADGVAYCWGNNARGALGTGDVTSTSEPVPVATKLRFASVSAGNHFTCAMTLEGEAWCWGANNANQLGTVAPTAGGCKLPNGNPVACSTVPVPVDGQHTFVSVQAGLWNGCAVTPAGEALCWGNNFYGQLGRGTTGGQSGTPTAVSGGLSFTQLSVGASHMCGIASNGLAYCWGNNMYGHLGNGTKTNSSTPVPVASSAIRFASISASDGNNIFGFTCATDANGTMYCWGANSAGQLGNSAALSTCGTGTRVRSCAVLPTAVDTDLRFESFDTGSEVMCAVSTERRGYCWGNNEFGALGNASVELNTSTPTPITATPGRGRGRQGPPADHKNHLTTDE